MNDTTPSRRVLHGDHTVGDRVRRFRVRFRSFRRTRPFWGCVVLALGAYFIISPVLTSVSVMVSLGAVAATGWGVGGIMLSSAVVTLIAPSQRHFAGVVSMVVSVASLVLTNLGGYIIGMLLGMIGSALIFGWAPHTGEGKPRGRHGIQRPSSHSGPEQTSADPAVGAP